MNYELIQNKYKNLTAVEQVLTNRGFNLEDIEHYLHTSDNDILPADSIAGMENGMKMLAKHLLNGDKIFVQVDCDADGYCSSAILLSYLHNFYPYAVENNITYGNNSRYYYLLRPRLFKWNENYYGNGGFWFYILMLHCNTHHMSTCGVFL